MSYVYCRPRRSFVRQSIRVILSDISLDFRLRAACSFVKNGKGDEQRRQRLLDRFGWDQSCTRYPSLGENKLDRNSERLVRNLLTVLAFGDGGESHNNRFSCILDSPQSQNRKNSRERPLRNLPLSLTMLATLRQNPCATLLCLLHATANVDIQSGEVAAHFIATSLCSLEILLVLAKRKSRGRTLEHRRGIAVDRSSEEAMMACTRQPSPRCGRREEFSTREFEVEKDANGEWIGHTSELLAQLADRQRCNHNPQQIQSDAQGD